MTTGQLSQIATVVTGHESALKLEKVNFSDGVTKNHSKSLKVTEKGYLDGP